MEPNQKPIPGRKATIIIADKKEEEYTYWAYCPNCNAIIFKGNFCSNCGLPTRWVTPSDTLEDRLSEMLMFALHTDANDLSDYMRNRQKETFRLIKEKLKKNKEGELKKK